MITKEAIEAGWKAAPGLTIAELEKRLADADRVIERVPPYLTDMYKAICNGNEAAANGFAEKDELVCAARAYMEGK